MQNVLLAFHILSKVKWWLPECLWPNLYYVIYNIVYFQLFGCAPVKNTYFISHGLFEEV